MSVDPKQRAEDLHQQAVALESGDDQALRLYHDALPPTPLRYRPRGSVDVPTSH